MYIAQHRQVVDLFLSVRSCLKSIFVVDQPLLMDVVCKWLVLYV